MIIFVKSNCTYIFEKIAINYRDITFLNMLFLRIMHLKCKCPVNYDNIVLNN